MTESLRTLLTGIVDYAGLYPPAGLGMSAAVETYARARLGDDAWMLGRFVCPVSRLEEFERAAAVLMPGTAGTSGYREYAAGEPWRLSAVLDQPLEAGLEAIGRFNERHESADAGQAVIDCVEMKVATVAEMDAALDAMPEDLYPFYEFPVGVIGSPTDCRGFVAALAGEQAAAKIRTGGVVPTAFPTPGEITAFINACAAAGVPFKATAGLHHPLRGYHPLTYEPGCAGCEMYGFVNVFLTAAFVRIKGPNDTEAASLLTEEEPDTFTWCDHVVSWKGHGLETAQLAAARERFCLSFGSCSFEEPTRELRALGWM
ncbi:MAG: hypothetical protein HBSAPP03_18610 [Phycisphaerae bacterium]|nr:MAG: hypothetical protein HBSAPP03_18610 [Phycisphaerae bacterium]